MKKDNAHQLLFEGRNLLKFAREEMARAEADVVSYLVCHNIRKATENLLNGFLALNGETTKSAPIDQLLKQCSAFDSRFAGIDLSPIECKGFTLNENDCHCTDFQKVQDCMNVVTQVERIVASAAMAY